jgi:hypothetical protein
MRIVARISSTRQVVRQPITATAALYRRLITSRALTVLIEAEEKGAFSPQAESYE